MKPLSLDEIDDAADVFTDHRVLGVVRAAVASGEARVYRADDGTLMYDDPFYSSDHIKVSDLKYDSTLGLHH